MKIRARIVESLINTEHTEIIEISDRVLHGRSNEEIKQLQEHYLNEWSKKFFRLSYEQVEG